MERAERTYDPLRRALLLRLGRRRLLVFAPTISAFGHLALETLYALRRAEDAGVELLLVRRRSAANEAIYHVTIDGVRNLHPTPLLRIAVAALAVRTFLRDRRDRLDRAVAPPYQRLLSRALHATTSGRVPDRLRRPLRRSLKRAAARGPAKVEAPSRPYFQRPLIASAHRASFCSEYEARAAAWGDQAGIPAERPLVAVHAREVGYKRGREVHETKALTTRDDSVRNADIGTYLPAVDRLVELGYTVVRLGDPSMEPLVHPGVVDLTGVAEERRGILDIHCLLRSRFLLGCESGPTMVAFLTGTPTLVANATDPISSFPIRRRDILLLKHVRDRETGRLLSLGELVSEGYLANVRNSTRYEYVSNTADEIVEALDEMLELLDDPPPPTPEQEAFATLALGSALALRGRLKYVRKWGAYDGFLGEGRIGRGFAARHAALAGPTSRI